MKEVKQNRYAGPFCKPPYKYFVQSPLGLVPKDNGRKTRLIFHLSYDFGKEDRDKSINFHTPKHLCSVKYNDLDEMIRQCLHLLKQTGHVVLIFGKSNLSNAFHLIPLLVKFRPYLLMMAYHPATGKQYFFVDKCLSFGSSISCAIFQQFSDALKHIVEFTQKAR